MNDIAPNGTDEVTHCQLKHLLRIHPFLEVTSAVWQEIHRVCKQVASPDTYLTSNLVDCIEMFKRQVNAH